MGPIRALAAPIPAVVEAGRRDVQLRAGAPQEENGRAGIAVDRGRVVTHCPGCGPAVTHERGRNTWRKSLGSAIPLQQALEQVVVLGFERTGYVQLRARGISCRSFDPRRKYSL